MGFSVIFSIFLLSISCVFGSQTYIYTDSDQSPFSGAWSWPAGSFSDVQSAEVQSGSAAFSWVPQDWNAAYFNGGSGSININNFVQLVFWIYRPAGSPTTINFNLVTYTTTSNVVGPNNPVASYLPGGTWPAGEWVQGTVPLSNWASAGVTSADGIWFQYVNSDAPGYTFYLDNIYLSTVSGSAPATVGGATTAAAVTTGHGATSSSVATSSGSSTTGASTGNSALADPIVNPLFSTITSGQGTYYGQYTSGGECSLDPTPTAGLNAANTVAIATNLYNKATACGLCLSVTGSGVGSGASPITGTRIVYVNNECPSCATDGIDFGISGDGVWDITYEAVPCPVGSTLIQYQFKSGSGPTWIGIQARNTKYPVYKLELEVGGTYVSLPLQPYNYFVQSFSTAVTFPAQIRLTSSNGEQVIDTLSSIQNGVIIQGTKQFA